MATILNRGEAGSGAILVVGLVRGVFAGAWERSLGAGGYEVRPTGPADIARLDDYLVRRRRSDPDLWVVELEGDAGLPERVTREVLG